MTHQPSQPTTDVADFTRRMMSNIDGSQDAEIAAIKARITELESNEADYESILGPRTYNEVAEHVRTMERTLQWIVNSPGAHPGNMVKVAEDALSHTGPVARDGER